MNSRTKKRITFWSSIEYGSFVTGVLRELDNCGYSATQRYCVTTHEYRSANTRWTKFVVRLKAYAVYPLVMMWSLLARHKGRGIHVVCTNTFYAPRLAAACARRGTVIHLLYDLYPDALETAGCLREQSVLSRLLTRVTSSTLKTATATVFLGRHLARHAANRYGEVTFASVIPVGADETLFPRYEEHNDDECARFLYCGHLGRIHDTDTLVDALRMLESSDVARAEFRFHAFGPKYPQLRRQLADLADIRPEHVLLQGSLREAEWIRAMREADVGIVTMVPGAENVVMPSKAYTALAAGQAILAICPAQSDLADLVREHECGWVVAPGDSEQLSKLILHICKDRSDLEKKRQNAWQAGHTVYSTKTLAEKWTDLIEQVSANDPTS